MDCDKYWELLALRPDGELSEEEERELEDHLAACPDCRAAGAQLAALQEAFPELEEVSAPEGFTHEVMDRIREEARPKVIPLFKRPQVRALAGLAACFVLVAGIYGISQLRNQEKMMMVTRSFQHDVLEETVYGADASACESLDGEADGPQVNAALVDPEEPGAAPEPTEAPQIAAYSAPQTDAVDGTAEKAAPEDAASENYGPGYLDRYYAEAVLTLDRMPEGGWELIPPETPASPDGLTVSVELMEQLERLAQEQGINVSRTPGPEASDHCLIVILDETE